MRFVFIFFVTTLIWADSIYMPYHTSHVRVHRDKNNQQYQVELPVESYAIDDAKRVFSVPPLIMPPKPVTYDDDEYEPELDTDYEPELKVPNL